MKKSAWDGDTVDLVCHDDATGAEKWRLPKIAISSMRTYLSVGTDVAQIDIDG